MSKPAPQKKASVLSELSKFVDKEVRVKFNGGREGKLSFVVLEMCTPEHSLHHLCKI